MSVDWLEVAQRLAAGARAKVAEDRRRLEELQAQKAVSSGLGAAADGEKSIDFPREKRDKPDRARFPAGKD